uniref:Interferon alpha-inducible protein 27-like protein 2 n=1 Tax=Bos indicus x Bos taurus TaxID=30522 RepID=A0A4W2G8B4_BOBOX
MISEFLLPIRGRPGQGAALPDPHPPRARGLASFPQYFNQLSLSPLSQERAAAAAIGGALAVAAVPAVLGAVGFTGAGIAASSLAAKMMSAAAVANGGGVAAGSLVATLQSVGAAGLSTSSNILLGSIGSAFGALLGGAKRASPSPPPGGPRPEGEQPGENVPQVEPPKSPLGPEKHEK